MRHNRLLAAWLAAGLALASQATRRRDVEMIALYRAVLDLARRTRSA